MSLVHKLLYTDEALKQIKKLNEKLKAQVRLALEEIAKEPSLGKPLTRELRGRFSYRVADYRIIYKVYRLEVLVLILTVGHRREVYKKIGKKDW